MKKKLQKRVTIFDEKGLTAFAEQLKKVRKDYKITQEKLAEKAGLTLSQIARIETVKTNPSMSTIFIIVRALNISLSEFFDFKLPK